MATDVYYSVGQNTLDHSSGGNVSLVSNVAYFTVEQVSDSLGVGDRLTYDSGAHFVWLVSKVSSTQWNVVPPLGQAAANHAETDVTSIRHEYGSLYAAIQGASDSTHINNVDLVEANVVLHIPCYYDTATDDTKVEVTGYTTGADNYIHIYTPRGGSESNISHRHNGTWGSGYRRTITLTIKNNYVRVDGLSSRTTQADWTDANCFMAATGRGSPHEIRISNCYGEVASDTVFDPPGGPFAVYGFDGSNGVVRVWNCIGVKSVSAASPKVFYSDDTTTVYWDNCTAIVSQAVTTGGVCFYAFNAWGLGERVVRNCLAYSPSSNCVGFSFLDGTNTVSYSASFDHTADNYGGSNNRVNQTFSFVDKDNLNFKLLATDGGAKDWGMTNPGSGLFSDDILGTSRPIGSAWDIGAHEAPLGDNVVGPFPTFFR